MLNLHLNGIRSSLSVDISVFSDSSPYLMKVVSRPHYSTKNVTSLQHNMTVERLLNRSNTFHGFLPVKSPNSHFSFLRNASSVKSRTAKSVPSFASISTSSVPTHPQIPSPATDSRSSPEPLALPPIKQPPSLSVSNSSPSTTYTDSLTNPQLGMKKPIERSQYAKSYTKVCVKVGSVTACGEARPRMWTPWSILLGYKDRPPAVLADKVLYFAFGSNMGVEKLQSRGGGIKLLAAEPGYVMDHRLAFNVLCLPPVEPSMASMEAEADSVTHGVLVALERAEYEELYMTEGGSGGEGRCYLEKVVTVTTYEGKEVQAVAFQTNPRSPQALPRWLELSPSRRYLNLLIRGATSSEVDPAYVDNLKQISAVFEARR